MAKREAEEAAKLEPRGRSDAVSGHEPPAESHDSKFCPERSLLGHGTGPQDLFYTFFCYGFWEGPHLSSRSLDNPRRAGAFLAISRVFIHAFQFYSAFLQYFFQIFFSPNISTGWLERMIWFPPFWVVEIHTPLQAAERELERQEARRKQDDEERRPSPPRWFLRPVVSLS